MSEQPSLILCMDNALGEEVALRIEPDDDFHVFLSKAKSALGYEVDINSITNNQPVSLDDNIYHFLLNSEHCLTIDPETGQAYAPDNPDDLLYILDDGTQIKSSQIHFDNEEPVLDLTAIKIPFVKYNNDGDDEDNFEVQDVRNYNISGSPIPQWCNDGSTSRSSFAKSLPYKLVCNDTAAFNAQYSRYVEASNVKTYANLSNASSDKSPRSLIRDNFKNIDDRNPTDDFNHLTREEILNMFKNPPAVPNNNYCFNDKRRHVRKTDPSRPGYNCWTSNIITINGSLLCPTKSQNCFICGIFVEKDKFYLFDNEDQRLHRSPTSKRVTTQLKVICKDCLDKNFKPSNLKDPNQGLGPDEYVVIQNNQQYVFRKTSDFGCNIGQANEIINKIESQMSKQKKDKLDFVKLEIGSDGEVTKLYDKDEIIEIKDEKDDSDVEIIEPVAEIDDTVIDNLENADEEVMQFLGKRQGDDANKELKCRFCERVFDDLEQVIKHGEEHKHDLDDGEVFPCPLCDYGYAKFLWLKGHLKAAHEKTSKEEEKATDAQENIIGDVAEPEKEKSATPAVAGSPTAASPIAQRTRSAAVKKQLEDNCSGESNEIQSATIDNTGGANGAVPSLTLKAEVKQEAIDTSDEEAIWIVQATGEGNQPSKNEQDNQKSDETTKPTCHNCDQPLPPEGQPAHRCRKRGRKRKPKESGTVVYVPTHEDFIKRAQGRPGTGVDCSDNKLLVDGKKKKTEPTSDPQIVTCHNCNESFTSKVRLKFHMQFHISNSDQTSDTYTCYRCNATMATESELFDHVHFQHHKQRRWQCPVVGCGKSFYLRATLTKHSRTHTDTRRYVCVTCGKKFLDKQTLDEHGVTHLQIKPFQCHICMKQLTRRSRLRMHLRAHEEELRPVLLLVCAHCKRAFRDQRDAEEHATKSSECIEAFTNTLKKEAEENCSQLLSPTSGLVRPINEEDDKDDISDAIPREVRDARSASLLAPLMDAARPLLRVVEIDKAFRCEYCEDVFYLDEGLNKHRHIHKGVKNPFICHICKVSFATYSRCTTHKTTHGFYKRSLEDAKRLALNPGPPAPGGASAIGILGYGGFPVVKHFLCEDCGRSYLHWTYLQVHRRMKHNNDNYIFKCNYCMLTFPNVWSVTYHRKKVHGKTGHDDRDGGVSKVLKEDHRIPCRDCDQVLPNKTALYKHRKKEHSDMTLMDNSEDCDSVEARPRRRCNNDGSYSRRQTPSSSRVKLKNELKNARKHPVDITVIELEGLNPSTDEIISGLSRNNIVLDKVVEISKMSFPKGSRNTIPNCGRALAALGHVPAESVHLSIAPQHKEYNVNVSNPRGLTATATRPKILQRTQYNNVFIQ